MKLNQIRVVLFVLSVSFLLMQSFITLSNREWVHWGESIMIPPLFDVPANTNISTAEITRIRRSNTTTTTMDPFYLKPLWNCHGNRKQKHQRNNKKLIFIHLFHTSTSFFRRFFVYYGRKCHCGVSVVSKCSNTANQTLLLCRLKHHQWRNINNKKKKKQQRMPSQVRVKFFQDHTDVLMGQVSLGIHRHLSSNGMLRQQQQQQQQQQTALEYRTDPVNNQYQYITFFRDPGHFFVSGYLRAARKNHSTLLLEDIQTHVRERVTQGRYLESYSMHLLTLEQKRNLHSREERVQQIKDNLIQYHVMVGIMEQMKTFFNLLQHLIDPKKSALPKLEPLLVAKKKQDLAQPWLKQLQQDSGFAVIFQDFLKYDTEIYNFAVELHSKQVQSTLPF